MNMHIYCTSVLAGIRTRMVAHPPPPFFSLVVSPFVHADAHPPSQLARWHIKIARGPALVTSTSGKEEC